MISSSQRPLPIQHKNTKRNTSMPSAVFEPAISAFKRLQTYALDRTTIGIGLRYACSSCLSRVHRKNKNLIVSRRILYVPSVSSYFKNSEVYLLFEQIFKSLLIANKTLLSFRSLNAIVVQSKNLRVYATNELKYLTTTSDNTDTPY